MMKDMIKIALIGAGNVATHLGSELAKAGYQILQVFSRTETSASALASLINDIYTKTPIDKVYQSDFRRCIFTNSINEITSEANLYIVMLKDSVLNEVLPTLVKCNSNALFVHTAGSVPMNIWDNLTNRFGVFYPMQTFSKSQTVNFEDIHIFIEANSAADVDLLKTIANKISTKVFEASSEQRKYLHLSAVFACNFTNHMYAICEELLQRHGLPFSSMLPLIDETARKVHHLSPIIAQTGPAQRNDTNVMQKQENLLKIEEEELATIYQLMSEHIQKYFLKNNVQNKI